MVTKLPGHAIPDQANLFLSSHRVASHTSLLLPILIKMPKTRLQCRPGPRELDTPRKLRFYHALDIKPASQSIGDFAKDQCLSRTTAYDLIRQRKENGDAAYRRSRKLSCKLGRPRKIDPSISRMLVNPKNPVRDKKYPVQIDHHGLECSKRTLQRALARDCNGARRFKKIKVKKLSDKQKNTRHIWGRSMQGYSIKSYWQHVVFTDEYHYDPSEEAGEWVLRIPGEMYEPENVQERVPKGGTILHCYAWINWHMKAPQLGFYNDKYDHPMEIEQPACTSRPRRRPTTETEEEYKVRLAAWEVSRPPKLEVKAKGNHMTGTYYTEHLLPVYHDAINEIKRLTGRGILLEDEDPSHGKRNPNSPAARYRKDYDIECQDHPSGSPDLNTIESIWSILKQRMRKRKHKDIEDLKRQMQLVWSEITRDEVKRRIKEMPKRCRDLARDPDHPIIRSNVW